MKYHCLSFYQHFPKNYCLNKHAKKCAINTFMNKNYLQSSLNKQYLARKQPIIQNTRKRKIQIKNNRPLIMKTISIQNSCHENHLNESFTSNYIKKNPTNIDPNTKQKKDEIQIGHNIQQKNNIKEEHHNPLKIQELSTNCSKDNELINDFIKIEEIHQHIDAQKTSFDKYHEGLDEINQSLNQKITQLLILHKESAEKKANMLETYRKVLIDKEQTIKKKANIMYYLESKYTSPL